MWDACLSLTYLVTFNLQLNLKFIETFMHIEISFQDNPAVSMQTDRFVELYQWHHHNFADGKQP